MSPAGLEDLARRFTAGTIPQAEWTHAALAAEVRRMQRGTRDRSR